MKEKNPLSIKLSKELHDRLIRVAEETGIPKHRLAELAIEAAVKAIERNNYQLVVPIEFEVTRVPSEKTSSRYPSHRDQDSLAEDHPAPRKRKPRDLPAGFFTWTVLNLNNEHAREMSLPSLQHATGV